MKYYRCPNCGRYTEFIKSSVQMSVPIGYRCESCKVIMSEGVYEDIIKTVARDQKDKPFCKILVPWEGKLEGELYIDANVMPKFKAKKLNIPAFAVLEMDAPGRPKIVDGRPIMVFDQIVLEKTDDDAWLRNVTRGHSNGGVIHELLEWIKTQSIE